MRRARDKERKDFILEKVEITDARDARAVLLLARPEQIKEKLSPYFA